MSENDLSETGRFIAYLRRNYRRIAVDLVLLVSWMLIGTEVLRLLTVPRWLQYVVLFVGVVVYVQLTPQWVPSSIEDR